jgi:4-amino-4-deoxy-L-arabinose transferase-like glycosyltransferase
LFNPLFALGARGAGARRQNCKKSCPHDDGRNWRLNGYDLFLNSHMLRRIRCLGTSPAVIAIVALAARILVILGDHTYQAPPRMPGWFFAAEMGKIAGRIASGQGFSAPYGQYAGPTAWIGPVYPLLLAGVFKIFGLYTSASAFVILAINSVFAALTCITIFLIARRVFGLTVALWAAWIWALLPYAIFWPTHVIWETSLSTFFLSVLFWLTLRMEGSGRLLSWTSLGLLCGITALTNAAVLSFLGVSLAWLWYRRRSRRAVLLARMAVLTVAFMAAVSPWLVRNYIVFGELVFPRSNFGEELLAGNHPGGNGLYWSKKRWDKEEIQKVGEIRYMAERRQRALQFIRSHPREFALFTLKRIAYFWCDIPEYGRVLPRLGMGSRHALYFGFALTAFWGLWLALKHQKRGAFLFLGLFLVYPLVYYITHCNPRYQHPITPEMLILTVYLFYAHRAQPSLMAKLWRKSGDGAQAGKADENSRAVVPAGST